MIFVKSEIPRKASEGNLNIKKTVLCVFSVLFSVSVLTGCNNSKSFSTQTPSLPKEISEKSKKAESEEYMPKNIYGEKRHQKYVLSSSFFQKNINVKSFNELKTRVKDGIRITQDKADMSEKEALLWAKIIKSKSYTMYTVDDAQKKYNELEGIIQQMAKKNNQTADEYIKNAFGLDHQQYTDFLKSQAAKFEQEYNEAKNKKEDPKTAENRKYVESQKYKP